jgi:hypothetical protein
VIRATASAPPLGVRNILNSSVIPVSMPQTRSAVRTERVSLRAREVRFCAHSVEFRRAPASAAAALETSGPILCLLRSAEVAVGGDRMTYLRTVDGAPDSVFAVSTAGPLPRHS